MFEIGPIFRAMNKNRFAVSLLVIEIAVTLALALNCFVVIGDQKARMEQRTGYDDKNIMFAYLKAYGNAYDDIAYLDGVMKQDVKALRAIPGVIDASPISIPPMIGGGSSSRFGYEGMDENDLVRGAVYITDENFLNTFGLELAEGRTFTKKDILARDQMFNETANVIISRGLADALFPDGDALGKTIDAGGPNGIVIGVLDYMFTNYQGQPLETRIVMYPGVSANKNFWFYMIRAEPENYDSVLAAVEGVILGNQSERLVTMRTMDEVKGGGFTIQNLLKTILSIVIVLLVFVTALGILGMNYFAVARRTRQIGVRRALGATKQQIVRFFLVENALIVLMGAGPGLIGAWFLNQYYLERMYNATSLSPMLAVAGLVLLWLIAALATLAPAFKAAAVQPAEATRVG